MPQSGLGREGGGEGWTFKLYHYRKSQLLDTAQTLKCPGLNDTPNNVLELIGSELNQIMKRITYPLRFGGRTRLHSTRS